MLNIIFNIIKKMKLWQVLLLLVGILAFYSFNLRNKVKFEKSEKIRQKSNYENILKLDSTKNATLIFNSKLELQNYLATNKDLKKVINDQKIKLRKVKSIINIKNTYIDSLSRRKPVTSIIQYIKQGIDTTIAWKDVSKCLVIKGNLEYKNDSLSVNILSRHFENTTNYIATWHHRRWKFVFFHTRLFGKRIDRVKVISKCGENKTITIKMNKKKPL